MFIREPSFNKPADRHAAKQLQVPEEVSLLILLVLVTLQGIMSNASPYVTQWSPAAHHLPSALRGESMKDFGLCWVDSLNSNWLSTRDNDIVYHISNWIYPVKVDLTWSHSPILSHAHQLNTVRIWAKAKCLAQGRSGHWSSFTSSNLFFQQYKECKPATRW